MVPLILLLTAVIFQVTTNWIVLSDEVSRNAYNDEYYDMARLAKRYLGALAKNKQLPIGVSVQERSVPPMISSYGQKAYAYPGADEPEMVESKRYLGSLAKSGDLNFSKPQQKKNAELENEEPVDEYMRSKGYQDDVPNFAILKLELIDSLKPVILDYIDQQKEEYDPKKVTLFLENLANAVYDRNEEFSVDNIKTLVKSHYFQPEESDDTAAAIAAAAAAAAAAAKKELQKRNIQSLVRDFNVSFGGSHRRASRNFRDSEIDDTIKRNLESAIKNKMYKRYVGAMAKNDAFPHAQPGKRYYSGFGSDLEEYLKTLQAKRHTMYDINEPDLTVEYPSQGAEQNDYTDYAEQMGQDAAIPIGKRYIGALARSGWLPRGFTERSNRMSSTSSFESKRHIGSLAKLGWLPSVHDSPTYYYRGGRGRDFKPPSFRGPRAYFLKADNDLGRCQCKRSSESRPSSPNWLADSGNEKTTDWTTQKIMKSTKPSTTTSLSAKNYFLIPVFDHLIFRTLYPNLQG